MHQKQLLLQLRLGLQLQLADQGGLGDHIERNELGVPKVSKVFANSF